MKALVAHMRFATVPVIQLVTIMTFFLGGSWLWLGAALLLVVSWGCDAVSSDYREPIDQPNRMVLDGTLYASVPLMALMMLCLVLFTASPGTVFADIGTVIGIGGGASASSTVAATLSVALISGPIVGAFGHELFHRTTRTQWWLGQVLLAHCLYTPLAIEHIHGHHLTVGTPSDFSTVPRGQGYWRYLPIAIRGTYRGAARYEAGRMRRRGRPWFSLGNRFLQGLALELGMTVAILAGGGLGALVAFLVSAAIGVCIMEGSNYVGHYGLVRVPGRPIEPRHSWNAPNFVATSLTINLTIHSHHHRSAGTPYWQLKVLDQAPLYPFGLAIMSAIATVPPIWFRVLQPLLDDWDQRLASPEELAMIRETTQPQLGTTGRSPGGTRFRAESSVRKRALSANEQ